MRPPLRKSVVDVPPISTSSPSRPPARRSRRVGVGLLVLLAITAGAYALIPPHLIGQAKTAAQNAFEACRTAGPLPFFTAMAVLPGLGFPLAPFTVAAGPLFAPSLGRITVIACATLAVMINVALSYWIASRLLRPTITRLVAWMGYKLPDLENRSAWIAALLLRIVPGPPFFLQSYLLGLMGVPFGVYMIVSTLVPLGYIASIVLFGDAIARGDPWGAAGAGILLFVVGGIIHQLRRRLTRSAPVSVPAEPTHHSPE